MVSLFLKIDFFFCFVFIHRLFIQFSEMLNFEMITFSKPTNFQQKPMCSCPIMNLQVPQKKGENDYLSKYLFMRCHKTAIEMSERRIRQEPLWRFHCHEFDNIS